MGTALQRLADELTAVLAGVLGYVTVLAVLGVGILYVLEIDDVGAAMESRPRFDQAAAGQPYRAFIPDGDRIERLDLPVLRRSVAAR